MIVLPCLSCACCMLEVDGPSLKYTRIMIQISRTFSFGRLELPRGHFLASLSNEHHQCKKGCGAAFHCLNITPRNSAYVYPTERSSPSLNTLFHGGRTPWSSRVNSRRRQGPLAMSESTVHTAQPPPPRGGSPDASHNRRKHPCVLCQQRKVKCDRNEPCNNCTRARVECISPSTLPPKRRKKRFPEAELLARLRKYEDHLRGYGADIDAINGGGIVPLPIPVKESGSPGLAVEQPTRAPPQLAIRQPFKHHKK